MNNLNFSVVAHVDAGKTTLTEYMLYEAGVTRALGRVDAASTVTDQLDMERRRGITIQEATVSFEWAGARMNLLDTPGHADFIAEVGRALQVSDLAVLVLSAKEGVQTQTLVLYRALRRYGIPVVFFMNKLDRVGAAPDAVLSSMRERLGARCVPLQRPHVAEGGAITLTPWWEEATLTEELVMELSETQPTLFEAYTLRGDISQVPTALCEAVMRGAVCPVLYGSALRGVGVKEVLSLLADVSAFARNDAARPLSGYVYKQRKEKGVRQHFVRLFQGEIALRDVVPLSHEPDTLTVRNLDTLRGATVATAGRLCAGEIAILSSQPDLRVGDVIGIPCDRTRALALAEPPMVSQVRLLEPTKRREMLAALRELAEEDPMLRVEIVDDTNEVLVRLFGGIQREFLQEQMRNRYGIEVELSNAVVVLKETPLGECTVGIGYKEAQHRGYLLQGALTFTVRPLPLGMGFVYTKVVNTGYLTQTFQNAVEVGVVEGLRRGLYGWELTDIEVVLADAYFSSQDSSPMDFHHLAPQVIEKALRQVGTRLLEPFVTFEAVVPGAVAAKVMHLLRQLGADVTDISHRGETGTLTGRASLSRIENFAQTLAGATGGLGVWSTTPDGYDLLEGEPVKKDDILSV